MQSNGDRSTSQVRYESWVGVTRPGDGADKWPGAAISFNVVSLLLIASHCFSLLLIARAPSLRRVDHQLARARTAAAFGLQSVVCGRSELHQGPWRVADTIKQLCHARAAVIMGLRGLGLLTLFFSALTPALGQFEWTQEAPPCPDGTFFDTSGLQCTDCQANSVRRSRLFRPTAVQI